MGVWGPRLLLPVSPSLSLSPGEQKPGKLGTQPACRNEVAPPLPPGTARWRRANEDRDRRDQRAARARKRGKGSRASCHAHSPRRLKPPGCSYFWAPMPATLAQDPLQAPGSPWDSGHTPSTTPTLGHASPLDSSLCLVGPGKQSQSQLWCLALLWHGLYQATLLLGRSAEVDTYKTWRGKTV